MAARYLAAQGIDVDAEMSKVQFGQAALGTTTQPLTLRPFRRIETVLNASVPGTQKSSLWDISISAGRVQSISPHDPVRLQSCLGEPSSIDAYGALLAPALCHPHIHLDKPYLLSHPKYSHLQIQRGDFAEAMDLTNRAKNDFEIDDLLERGQRLVDESISAGVTSMRAFVEVDPVVDTKCLDAGITLKNKARDKCDIQICAFAQLALFSVHEDDGENMRSLVRSAAQRAEVDVVGSTPYVETTGEAMKKNIEWTIELALSCQKHVDLHLDYNLDPDNKPLVWHVIETLKAKNWTARTSKSIVLGHCTRLCLFSPDEWRKLKHEIDTLPISFVGLPTSDLFMMRTENQTRGTLPIPSLVKDYGINAAIGINNIGNAFTPQGCCDPLSIASMGVGVYQAGTVRDVETLYECISTRARSAIGLAEYQTKESANSMDTSTPTSPDEESESVSDGKFHPTVLPGQPADLLLFGKDDIEWRTRKSISEAVYLYDGANNRICLKGGVLVE